MAKDNAQSWEKIEEQAYHAFREWPIWLVLRQAELSQHLQPANTLNNPIQAATTQTLLQPTQVKSSKRSKS